MIVTYTMTAIVLFVGLALMLVDAQSKLKNNAHSTISIVLITGTMFYIAIDCLWVIEYTAYDYSEQRFAVLNLLLYLINTTLPYIWFLFAQHFVSDLNKNRWIMLLLAVPWAVNLALVIATAAGGNYLWIAGDSTNRYARGPLFDISTNLNLAYFFIPVIEIALMLLAGPNRRWVRADRRTLFRTLGFSLIPALSVCIYTRFISFNDFLPFQPCCFFLGVMFAYILLISQAYDQTEQENRRLNEEAAANARIAQLSNSISSLLINMPALTFSKDVETGVYLACNQLYAAFAHKQSPSGVVGLTDYEIFDPITAKHFVETDRMALSMDKPYIYFEDVLDAGGNPRQFQTTKLQFTDASGRLCTLGMCVDVTETFTLKRETDEAREASEAKSAFLASMSHDIRTPMNAIVGFTNLAMQDVDDADKTLEYLTKISSSSNHLLSLVNNVLEMSQIESGKMVLSETPCSLPQIFHDLNAIVIGQIEGKDQHLSMCASGIVNENVYCDKLRVNQILLNLVSNAIKYTPEGGHIWIRLAQLEATGEQGTYEIRVKDDGIGMSPEFAARIFNAFERESKEIASDIQGTGLGMAITKRFVDLMGGEISVITARGKGSEFIVRLSFRVLEPETLDTLDALQGSRALVVDADAECGKSTSQLLAQLGMNSEITAYGKDAVFLARQACEHGDGFDVFVVDSDLPDISIAEVARQLRRGVGKRPALVASTYNWADIKDEALAAGFNTYCNKPIFFSELHETLQRATEGAAEPEEPKAKQVTADFTGRRVLLVDDMEVNRQIANIMLTTFKFSVEQATNGQEAYDMVREAKPGYYDVIIMDIQMPVMNGYEAARAIRGLEGPRGEVPIVAMTANAFDEDKRKAMDSGMNGHVAKPVDASILVSTLQEVMR